MALEPVREAAAEPLREFAAEAASSGRFEAFSLCPRRPEGADAFRQRLANLLDLVRIEIMVENLEGHMRSVFNVDRPYAGETLRHVVQELFRRALLQRLLARVPLVVIETPYQERQLRAEMNRQSDLKAIAQRVQDSAEHMPRHLAVGPELGHDLVEPDVGGLQGLVDH